MRSGVREQKLKEKNIHKPGHFVIGRHDVRDEDLISLANGFFTMHEPKLRTGRRTFIVSNRNVGVDIFEWRPHPVAVRA